MRRKAQAKRRAQARRKAVRQRKAAAQAKVPLRAVPVNRRLRAAQANLHPRGARAQRREVRVKVRQKVIQQARPRAADYSVR